ncbi:MAG: class I SAM-dependent methyltransferase [Pirellulales bacterium]|jgi:ubiquinone/menaquinone biosynthesis C-methylase UbiE
MRSVGLIEFSESVEDALNQLRVAVKKAPASMQLSDERFDITHEAFECSSSQQQLVLRALKELISSHAGSAGALRILSVGCGSGILDNQLISAIASSPEHFEYTGVDPNPVACRRFREDFEKLALPNVKLEVRTEAVESLNINKPFDIIQLTHALYYFKDPADTLGKLRRLLAPGGKLIIVQAPNEYLNQLSECFWSHHAGQDIWFSKCLEKYLIKQKIEFTCQRIYGEVDVTRCFNEGCPHGEKLLDFITQSDCRESDTEVRERCLHFLKKISRVDGESLKVEHPTDVFVVV